MIRIKLKNYKIVDAVVKSCIIKLHKKRYVYLKHK